MEEDTTSEEEERLETQQTKNVGNSKKSLLWRVGKKIVITGVVISSAPFVLPPLIVASTAGFAFSVPFGLVFAGYACTEKVMSVLLPAPDVGARGWEEVEDYGTEEEGFGEDEVCEENGAVKTKVWLERTDDTEVDDSVEDDPRVVEIRDAMEEMQGNIVENGKVETTVGLRRTDDAEVDDKAEGDVRIDEIEDVVEERRIGEVEDSILVEEKEVKAILVIEGADESGSDVFGDQSGATSEMRHVSVEVSSAEEEHSSPMMVKENVTTVRVERSSSPSKEVPYTEQQIWELLHSMRKVVGYKGAMQPTFCEELKTLYSFTGVDPAPAFKDPLDLVETSDKLRLLMTIVGDK